MNEALKIRILGRVILLLVFLPLIWFTFFVFDGLARFITLLGIVIASFVLSKFVDKIAERKSLPSPSEIEKY